MTSYYNYGKFNDMKCYENNIDTFLKSVGILSCGFFFSFYLVSLFYKKDFSYLFYSKYNNFEEEEDYENYENKYYEDFRKLNNDELSIEDKCLLKNYILFENTPYGEVVMNYNHDTESFYYWCDNKNIKYMVLDSVVHKYALEYNCKSVCVDYKNEYDDGLNILRNIEEELENSKSSKNNDQKTNDEKTNDEKEKSVFVKYKNYKNDLIDGKSKPKFLVTKNSNRFSYKGNIEEYYKSKNEIKKKEVKKNISYSDFKKSNNQ